MNSSRKDSIETVSDYDIWSDQNAKKAKKSKAPKKSPRVEIKEALSSSRSRKSA